MQKTFNIVGTFAKGHCSFTVYLLLKNFIKKLFSRRISPNLVF